VRREETRHRDESDVIGHRDVDAEAVRLFPSEFLTGLGAMGLCRTPTLIRRFYPHCTPLSCWCFAATGRQETEMNAVAGSKRK
jgi:hypothetical protein